MADVCPVCNAPFREEPSCYRCKADLTALFELRRGTARLLARARSACRAGDLARAFDLARGAQALRRTAEGEELELLLLFRTGRPDDAYRRWLARRG
ncbi:MAG: hypothetical protein HY900_13430 [Deltaproteobacteria bacterium]|nr:hypothetical protein [Deltaproteobacteria bacterium]